MINNDIIQVSIIVILIIITLVLGNAVLPPLQLSLLLITVIKLSKGMQRESGKQHRRNLYAKNRKRDLHRPRVNCLFDAVEY